MAGKQTLNVAVIGLGMGKVHLHGYRDCERAKPVAICDLDAERLEAAAAENDIPRDNCFSDYRDLFARARELRLDAVSVALPNFLHAPVTLAAFKVGLHVLCEKPIAMSAAEGRAMIAAAKKARRNLMINFSYRFTEQGKALKKFVDSGALGRVYFGRSAWHRRWGMPGFGGWFGTKKLSGGGPIIDLGVHRLDLAMWLMGSPHPVTVSGGTWGYLGSAEAKRRNKTFDVEDMGCAMIRFDNGATIILEASFACFGEKKEDMSTQLFGTKGGLIHRNVGEGYDFEARVFTSRAGAVWDCKLQRADVGDATAYTEFTDACLDGRSPSAPGEHGLDVQLILDAIYKSAQSGREIRIRS